MELVETELLGHRRRNLLAVAREHDGALTPAECRSPIVCSASALTVSAITMWPA